MFQEPELAELTSCSGSGSLGAEGEIWGTQVLKQYIDYVTVIYKSYTDSYTTLIL